MFQLQEIFVSCRTRLFMVMVQVFVAVAPHGVYVVTVTLPVGLRETLPLGNTVERVHERPPWEPFYPLTALRA